jgi:hypothetical protein
LYIKWGQYKTAVQVSGGIINAAGTICFAKKQKKKDGNFDQPIIKKN